MNALINISAFDIETTCCNLDIFFKKSLVLQILEMWLSNERLLSNNTPRLLTDNEDLAKQLSSVRQCSSLLHSEDFGPIINHNQSIIIKMNIGQHTSIFYKSGKSCRL